MPRRKKEQRREKGEGGLYQRGDGRWCASLDLPAEFPGGPRRRKVFYGATREEAREKRMEWQVGTKKIPEPSVKGSLGEIIDYWLDNVKAFNIEDVSLEAYRNSLKHTKPIQHIQLPKLSSEQIQTCIAKIARTMGAATAALTLRRLNQVLRYALKTKKITYNPAESVEAPRHTKKAPVPLTSEQAQAFIDAVTGHRLEAAFWLSLCGLRTGEVRGAQWDDVDWEAGSIRVQRQAKRKIGGMKLGKTKTESSVRTVYLTPQAMSALRRTRELWRQEALARVPEARNLIVVSVHGKILHYSTYTQAYTVLLKRAGIPHTALHNLRHTFATLAIDSGASPSAVQAQLGHKTPDMTFAYTHPTNEGQSRSAEVYGEAIQKKKAT